MRTLETRLLLSFLLLACVPALLVSLVATRRISAAIDRLQNPGVEASVTHAPLLYTELVERWAEAARPLLAALPRRYPDPSSEAVVRKLLEEASLAFAVWESERGEPRAILAVGVGHEHLPVEDDWKLLHGIGAPSRLRGRALRFFHAGEGPGTGRAIGLLLREDISRAMASVGRDYGRYLQLERFEAIQKRLVWLSSAMIFLIAAGAATWVARVTARRISRPVHELADAADRVAAGDLSHRTTARADGEIGDLVAAFTRMTGQLERSRDELIRMERVAAWRDAARRVAHEIRNPLTPVRLAVHRLGSRVAGDEQALECLRSIAEEVENLARISEAFSEFAKLPEARFAPTDLAQVAGGVVELFRESAPGVRVELHGEESVPLVADRDHLRRAATNLVKNATEAVSSTGRPGTVRVGVHREGGLAVLEVADDGPGVPPEIREGLFRPGVSGRPGGSGLGLAMVQRIASDHRGALRWDDGDPGARFRMEIPLDLPEEA